MKKIIFVISMLLTVGQLGACSSDDEFETTNLSTTSFDKSPDSPEDSVDSDGLILPIEGFEGYAEIAEFFNSELPLDKSRSFFVNPNENTEETICKIINSMSELQDLYSGNKDLPELDFQQYTLVIGQKIMPDSYHTILRQEVDLNKDPIELNLYIPNTDGGYSAIQHLYFWGLYPKIQTNNISLNIIKVEER